MRKYKPLNWQKFVKAMLLLIVASVVIYSCDALATAHGITRARTIADIANNIVDSFQSVGKLLIASAYLVGISLIISALFKFKKNRDNPNQIPLSAPIATFAVGILLIFLPAIIAPAGVTIFGGSKASLQNQAGGFQGTGASSLPGYEE